MKRLSLLGGIGGVVFAVCAFGSIVFGAAPGGNYTPSDVTSFVASGHRAAVFVALYLAIFSTAGLVFLFARLRAAIAATDGGQLSAGIFWGAGLAVSIAFLLGWITALSVPVTYAFSHGGYSIAPTVTYTIVEVGLGFVLSAGGTFMGLTLIGLFVVARHALPAWLRWVTLIAGIVGLASPTFFPYLALLLWGLVTGIWLLPQAWRNEEATVQAPAGRPRETVAAS